MAKAYDATSKQLFEQYPRDWLAMLGWPLPPAGAGVTPIDTDLSTVSPVADKLVRVDFGDAPYLAHVEFQTTADRDLDGRMLQYNVLARVHHGLPVRSVAFLFRPSAANGPTGRIADHLDEHSWLTFAYRLVPLWTLPTADLMAGPLGTLPLAPLTVPRADVPAVVARIGARLRAEVPRGRAAELAECTRLLLGLIFDDPESEVLMPSLQKLIEEESSTYKATIQRGRVEGRVEGRLELLLRMGTEKFGPPHSGVLPALRAVTATADQDRLATRLLRVNGWDELLGAE